MTFAETNGCREITPTTVVPPPAVPIEVPTSAYAARNKCERCGRAATTANGSAGGTVAGQAGTAKSEGSSTEENEIAEKAKLIGQLLVGLVEFTRGASEMKNTQDFFTQAEFLAEEANKFYKLVRQFTYLVGGSFSLSYLIPAFPVQSVDVFEIFLKRNLLAINQICRL